MLLEIGQHAFFQHGGDGIAVLLGDCRPIGLAAEIGHHRQHIKTVATFRCQRWVCRGGAVQVQAEVFGQRMVFKNILQQTFVAWT